MGTAMAMHLARAGNETVLWASEFDRRILPELLHRRAHPNLPAPLPESLAVLGPEDLRDAAKDVEVAVMGAHSGGARTLARIVMEDAGSLPLVVGIAKGLEPDTGKRMSRVYAEEVGHENVVAVGGPCLAPEVAQGLPTAAVFASVRLDTSERAAEAFSTERFVVSVTQDLPGVEYCTVAKNVAAIAVGIMDGLGKTAESDYRNAKAALFAQAMAELSELVVSLGGRRKTAAGLAGLGDALVTSLGGRNRLYGELIGEGADPKAALEDLLARGMTVEGVACARDVHLLAGEKSLDLRVHEQVHQILFDSAPPSTLFDCLKG